MKWCCPVLPEDADEDYDLVSTDYVGGELPEAIVERSEWYGTMFVTSNCSIDMESVAPGADARLVCSEVVGGASDGAVGWSDSTPDDLWVS